ncbi:MAG: hypothetical protein FWG18_02245 [Alphaproteobacteria bacterium]|nr:hypothetical protein [Alphaproteobacteria bacterium]
MKKFIFLSFILFATDAFADTNFYLGGTFGHHTYKETIYMEQSGYLAGGIAKFQHYGTSREANLYLFASADYARKNYTYKGSLTNILTDAKTPYQFKGAQNNYGADAQIGPAFNFREIGDDSWVLFTGASYRRFEDLNDLYSPYGYRRIRNSFFWTLGTKYIWKIGNHIITPSLMSGTSVYSKNVSKRDVDVIHRQKAGSLFELSVSYEYWFFWIEPYFKYQHFDNSKKFTEMITLFNGMQIENVTIEPANTTREIGFNIGIRF